MNPYVLEMKEIEKSFGVPVLKGVNFSLKKARSMLWSAETERENQHL